MGIFDFFTKEVDRPKDARGKQAAVIGKPINSRESNGGAMQVFHPRSFDDVQKIIETLKANKPAIVYLNTLKKDDAQRALDMLSGAIFALDGGVMPIEKDIYIFTLDGVTLRK
ncbi:MAG: cell division protein SepF [Clostridia bacterium]|nr:cell division protein SepF [Clostridia bacterium]